MRFKIDENLHTEVAELFRQRGHDALTVYEQGLRGHADGDIAGVCRQEGRAIVTLDLDFSDVRVFPPQEYAGIVILRLVNQSRRAVLQVLERVMPLFDTEVLSAHLWIVDEYQVRVR